MGTFMPDHPLLDEAAAAPEEVKVDEISEIQQMKKPSAKKEHSKNRLPPTPKKRGARKRKGSREVDLSVEDEEPDWEIQGSVSPNGKNPFEEPSFARGTQEQILRSYLEERIGAEKLQQVINCL